MQSSIGHLELKNSTKALEKMKINNSRMPALSLANGVKETKNKREVQASMGCWNPQLVESSLAKNY